MNATPFFPQLLIEEAWEFDRAKRWMIGNATKRPMSTIILFKAVLPQQPRKAIALGQELTAIQTRNGQQGDAMGTLEAIWQYRTQHGIISFDAVTPALQLAAIYEKNGQREDSIKIRTTVWRLLTRYV